MLRAMNYELTLDERPDYLHATVRGDRTPDNCMRFLVEAYEACVRSGRSALLLELRLTGHALGTPKIFEVISARSAEGMKLRKIAYVDIAPGSPEKPLFAETVARNRGVNVRLFPDIAAADRWLRHEEEP